MRCGGSVTVRGVRATCWGVLVYGSSGVHVVISTTTSPKTNVVTTATQLSLIGGSTTDFKGYSVQVTEATIQERYYWCGGVAGYVSRMVSPTHGGVSTTHTHFTPTLATIFVSGRDGFSGLGSVS